MLDNSIADMDIQVSDGAIGDWHKVVVVTLKRPGFGMDEFRYITRAFEERLDIPIVALLVIKYASVIFKDITVERERSDFSTCNNPLEAMKFSTFFRMHPTRELIVA